MKKKLNMFVIPFSIILLFFALISGLAIAYKNSYNTVHSEHIEVLDLQRNCDEYAELTVMGTVTNIPIDEDIFEYNELKFAIIPSEMQIVFMLTDLVEEWLSSF